MNQRIYTEVPILSHYFGSDTAVQYIVQGMREGMLGSTLRRFDRGLILRAQREVQVKRRALDASTYAFAQDFYPFFIQTVQNRGIVPQDKAVVIMLAGGDYVGRGRRSEGMVAIDMGTNPHVFFKDHRPFGTIDEAVTFNSLQATLKSAKFRTMKRRGYSHFAVDKSGFFYVPSSEYRKFNTLEELVPYLHPVHGTLNGQEVVLPTLDDYVTGSPDVFMSHRHKKSIQGKLMSKLRKGQDGIYMILDDSGKIVDESGVISDWDAGRVKVRSREESQCLLDLLKDSPEIGKNGRTKLEFLWYDDKYRHTQVDAFKALKVVMRVKTVGYEPIVREMQIVTGGQYWNNEYRTGRTDHRQQDKRRAHVKKDLKKLQTHYSKIVAELFKREESPHLYDDEDRLLIPL